MPFSVQDRIGSFRHAFRGLATLLGSQHNAWLHFGATVAAFVLGCFFTLARGEWVAILLAIGMVWMAEALNTSVEFLADEVSLERRDLIGKAKDVGAAGVLIASAVALAVGIVIFGPHVLAFLRHHDA